MLDKSALYAGGFSGNAAPIGVRSRLSAMPWPSNFEYVLGGKAAKQSSQSGSRPYRQIIVRGYAQVQPDTDELWARKLILKYITGQAGALRAQQSAGKPLAVIALRPERFLTTGNFPAQ